MIGELGIRNSEFRLRKVSRIATKCKVRSHSSPRFTVRCVASRLLGFRLPPSAFRPGISLTEVLISMFVLLFGLMGVAAIFPVGNFYVVQGENFDLGSGLAQNAFEELQARGMLRPEVWVYSDAPSGHGGGYAVPWMIHQAGNVDAGRFVVTIPTALDDPHPGHAFVLDPLGAANSIELRFPYQARSLTTKNPWSESPGLNVPGDQWPVRRMTLLDANGLMITPVAETIFRLRDDLSVSQPDQDDRPSVQTWDIDNTGAQPLPLRRQYQGDYSWLATIVPKTEAALVGLQPAHQGNRQYLHYDVSVVVFRKRDTTPSNESERLIEAELLPGGELVMFNSNDDAAAVDATFDGVRPGNWVSVMGVNQTTGGFLMKWYRLLSLDNETNPIEIPSYDRRSFPARSAMLVGPDWPGNSIADLRVAILPDVVSVTTKEMRMQD